MTSDRTSTQEAQKLFDYEMVFIVSPELDDERLETTVQNVSKLITDRGGTVATMDKWGKRRLAYPINGFSEGNYILAKFKMGGNYGKELEANLGISEEILRHLLVRLES